MNVEVGTAPNSWGVCFSEDERQIPWYGYLDEAAAAGYQWTELGPYGYLPKDVKHLRRELEKRGLSGTFAMGHLETTEDWSALREQIVSACESVAALGGKFLVLIDDTYTDLFSGNITRPSRLTNNQWRQLIDHTHAVADIVHGYNLVLVFDPHAETHVEYEKQIELFLTETDPDRLSSVSIRATMPPRRGSHTFPVETNHLKNVDAVLRVRALAKRVRVPFAKAVAMGIFCERIKNCAFRTIA